MPRPDPMVLAAVMAFSAFLAALVLFQGFLAVREWRLRRTALSALRGNAERQDPLQARHSLVRADRDEDTLLQALAERIPKLWDLHHTLVQSGLE